MNYISYPIIKYVLVIFLLFIFLSIQYKEMSKNIIIQIIFIVVSTLMIADFSLIRKHPSLIEFKKKEEHHKKPAKEPEKDDDVDDLIDDSDNSSDETTVF